MLRYYLRLATLVLTVGGTSRTQITWTKHPENPVVPVFSGDIDDPSYLKYALAPAVTTSDDLKLYRMWFVSLTFGYGTSLCVSEAVSVDGARWYGYMRNPAVKPGPGGFDSRSIYNPSVITDATGYKLFYAGYDESRFQVGLATSADGSIWVKHPANPVLPGGPPGSWNTSVRHTTVLIDSGTYKMWFDGWNAGGARIGYAWSSDGVSWTQHSSNPVFGPGPGGAFDDRGVGECSVVKAGGIFHMIYTGYHESDQRGEIGYAYSTDGIAWVRYSGNPVLRVGPAGSWDAGYIAAGSVILKDNTLHMWYAGAPDSRQYWQLGYATAPLTPLVVEYPPSDGALMEDFRVDQNYPNPFNPATSFRYMLPERCSVECTVYDLLGREVRVLKSIQEEQGWHTVEWRGDNARSAPTGSGLYVAKLEATGVSGRIYRGSVKMLLAR